MTEHGVQQKIALVTGVSRGIGEIIANFFLERGWRVHGISRSKPNINHQNFFWHQADLSREPEVARVAGVLEEAFDCVVLNAGMLGPMGSVIDISMQGWREAFDLNFFAPLALAQALTKHAKKNAAFIFLSGGGAVTPVAGVGPYAISKLAVVKLVEQLSIEDGQFRFYAIAPGAVDTEIFREHHERSGGGMPRFTKPEEIEKLIERFLADTNRLLNGKLIHVRDDIEKLLAVPDGGFVRRVEAR